ncbi:MAG: energy-coupling factor transporter transmembrane protein EcfT [Clostridia bacterium]|nr:energy-coupling factor transporter transmembrane protein EcfT [Clostridia bacterium]
MREMTLGQYYAVNSPVHALDPRTKILSVISMMALIFLCRTFCGLAACACFVLAVSFAGHIPLSKMMSSLKAIYFLLLFTFLLNVFFNQSGAVLWQWGILNLTSGGIKRALFMALRLVLLVTGAGLLSFTTSPIELTDGLESLMTPLKKLRFPAHEIAMMMSIALRFIPILTEETDKIRKAQTARGANFDSGSLYKRAGAVVSLLVPLLVSAFRRAEELAMAMEARCYHGGEGRTRLKVLRFHASDAVAAAVVLALAAFIAADQTVIVSLLPDWTG